MTRDQILNDHSNHIGASEAAQAVGLSRWGDPLKLYAKKAGLIPRTPDADNGPLYFGNILEPIIAAEYERRRGVSLTAPETYFSIQWPCLVAHLDRVTCTWPEVNVQLKTWDRRQDFGPAGSDQVPDEMAVQVQIECLLAGIELTHIAVLFHGTDYQEFVVPFHRELAETVANACEALMLRVRENDPPAPDWSKDWTRAIHGLLNSPVEKTHKTLSAAAGDDAAEYCDLGRKIADLTERRARLLGRILEEAGDVAKATMPNGYRLSRWNQLDGVRFRVLEPSQAKAATPYALPEMTDAESLEAWMELEGKSIEATLAAM